MTLPEKEFKSKMDDINFVKKQRTFFYLTNVFLVAVIAGILFFKPVRFSLTHLKATTNFMNRYLVIEKTANDTAKDIINTWSETGEIK